MAGPETLFVSDLHLAAQRPETEALFLRLLEERAAGAAALYILGDLFDAWIGDDDDAPLPARIRGALGALTAGGTRLFVQRGNRDFLLGRRFCRETGAVLLGDRAVAGLADGPVLLMHGDLLCTDDLAYQRARRWLRNPLLQWLFLRRPLANRRKVAGDYRRRSGEAVATKPAAIMDVNPRAVAAAMRRAGVHRLIHGHTHRPGHHIFTLDGAPAQRWVLGDWHPDHAEILVATPAGLRSERFQ